MAKTPPKGPRGRGPGQKPPAKPPTGKKTGKPLSKRPRAAHLRGKKAEEPSEEAENPRAKTGHNRPPAVVSQAAELDRITAEIRDADRQQQDILCGAVVDACRVYYAVKKGPGSWTRFVGEDRWKKVAKAPKLRDTRDALHFVFRWIFGMTGEATKRASFYSRAVKPLLDEGVELEELAEVIKERGGFKKLAALAAKKNREEAAKKGTEEPESDQDDDDDGVDVDEDDDIAPLETEQPPKPRPPSRTPIREGTPHKPSKGAKAAPRTRKENVPTTVELVGETARLTAIPTRCPLVVKGQIIKVGAVVTIEVTSIERDAEAEAE